MEERTSRLLIVDDEERIRKLLRLYMERDHYIVDEAGDGVTALERALKYDYDLIVLDIMLPGMNGIDMCRQLRRSKQTPVMIVTASGNEHERLQGFEAGADDYVVKPFSAREVAYRINAIVNRSRIVPFSAWHRSDEGAVILKRIVIEPKAYQVLVEGKPIYMALKEYELFLYLALHPGIVFTREELLKAVWGHSYIKGGDYRTVDTHIKRIRTRLNTASRLTGSIILTVWGVGYCLQDI
ncbi:response regulator transcription factor (plasmid) [Paenibacillus rhizovicinus]|uniref:Response regulator transcription factor n=1 Tax=Paenibacillus rhizovicinus TaxID=2704463 RepID=A0A6C0PC76_9BACL|nr:response regulator transcription factor [Paenibacillus rhizovicinus]QHW35403.1 response regulator transcription factor [Paenibacillus rhizovicinus]